MSHHASPTIGVNEIIARTRTVGISAFCAIHIEHIQRFVYEWYWRSDYSGYQRAKQNIINSAYVITRGVFTSYTDSCK